MKTDTMIVPCKAYDLLSKADVIIVNDYHLKSWILDPIISVAETLAMHGSIMLVILTLQVL